MVEAKGDVLLASGSAATTGKPIAAATVFIVLGSFHIDVDVDVDADVHADNDEHANAKTGATRTRDFKRGRFLFLPFLLILSSLGQQRSTFCRLFMVRSDVLPQRR
jgi:hypothetical protein